MISFIKKTVSIAAAAACMLTSLHFTYITEVKEADAASGMNAFEITREMKIGWNLGNSLDATGGNGYTGVRTEESWGNPKTTKAMIDTVKAKGFNTVRIPTTWYPHLDGNNNIDSAWMARVKEVVDYCIDDDMYVILNVHHEDWVNVSRFTDQTYQNAEAKISAIWRQVAEEFKDYDQHLVFEGLNEPRQTDNPSVSQWGNGEGDNGYSWNYINKLNAKFVETVRRQGSDSNKERLLMLPGYCASSDMKSIRAVTFPSNCGNVAYSVHAYLPYYFTMAEDSYSNHNYPGQSGWGENYTDSINSFFSGLKQLEDEKNIPVVIGEFSASNFNNLSARKAWAKDYITQAKKAGIPCILWDNNVEGGNGGESHGYLDRRNNRWYSASEGVIDTMMSVINDNSILWAGKPAPVTTTTAKPVVTTTTTKPKETEPYPYDDYFVEGFEDGKGNWTGRGSAAVKIDHKNYYSDLGSLFVSEREREWNGCLIQLSSDLFIPGETYSFSAAVLQKSGSDVTIQMSLQQAEGDSAVYNHVADCKAKSGEWTKIENVAFTIPEKEGDLFLYFETPEDSGDLCDFYVDQVQASKAYIPSKVVTGQGVVESLETDPRGGLSKDGIIRIMPVGDSITFGLGDTGGYRKYLHHFLREKGYTQIDMVGPEGKESASFNYNGQDLRYDDNNAGYSGYTIVQKYPVPSWGENGLLEKLRSKNAVASAKPDIVLLIIGTNDMTANRNLSECEKDLHSLIDYMLSELPSDGMIFMGSIPEFTEYGGNAQRIAGYNNTVKKVADEYASSGKNVRFADVHGCLDGMNDIGSDKLHPNSGGYEKIGKFWAGIVDDYVTSSAPAATTTTSTAVTTTTTTTTTASTTAETTTTQNVQPTVWGDADGDNTVKMNDAVIIMQALSNPDRYGLEGTESTHIKQQGWVNANVYENSTSSITPQDALQIQRFLLGIVTSLAPKN